MTNAHVVSGAQRVQIVLPAENADGTLATALSGQVIRSCRAHRRHHHRTGPGAAEGRWPEASGAAAGDLLAGPAGRDGVCVRQPDRAAQQPDARAGLGRGAAGRSRFAADLRADGRADQSRQFGRPAGQHPRRSRRRQHVHRVAVRRQRRSGLRRSERDGQNGVPPAQAVRSAAPAGSGHEHADHHAGHGGGARPGRGTTASSCPTSGPAARPRRPA